MYRFFEKYSPRQVRRYVIVTQNEVKCQKSGGKFDFGENSLLHKEVNNAGEWHASVCDDTKLKQILACVATITVVRDSRSVVQDFQSFLQTAFFFKCSSFKRQIRRSFFEGKKHKSNPIWLINFITASFAFIAEIQRSSAIKTLVGNAEV